MSNFNPMALLAPQSMTERYDAFRFAREAMPVFEVPGAGIWLLLRYDDVYRAISEPALFSSDFSRFAGPSDGNELLRGDPSVSLRSLTGLDAPDHHKLRSLVSRAFTPRVIEALTPRITTLVDELLDAVVEHGETDIIADLGDPLPTAVISIMLGVQPEYRDEFKKACALMIQADPTREQSPDVLAAGQFVMARIQEVIEARRLKPEDDLMTGLINAEVDGVRLTEREIVAFALLLLIAGSTTTTHLIANTLLAFLDNPDEMARVKADYSLLPMAIEESIRYYAPALTVFRTANQDIELSGVTVPAGARVFPMLASANRDPRKFAEPEKFDVGRNPNPHIGFGFGVHYCLGAPLARLEGRIALTKILQRLPDLQRADNGLLAVAPGFLINSLLSLPLCFTSSR